MDYSKQNNNKKRMKRKMAKDKVTNSTGILIFRVILAVVLIMGFGAAGALAGAYFGILQDAQKIAAPTILPNIYSSYIVDEDMNEILRLEATENRTYVNFDQISQSFKDALVAIEDERFYSHNGIDIRGIFRAIRVNLSDSDRVEGASTITQQLIKNNILERQRNTLESKLQEQYIAIQYEKYLVESFGGNKRAAKDYILEVYMNSVSFGYNINGVQAAAKFFFDKDASDLTLSESAVIAGITQWPTRYVPDRHPEANAARRKVILDKMLELGKITQREYDEAMADDPYDRIRQSSQVLARQQGSTYTYFTDSILESVAEDLQKNLIANSPAEAYNIIYNGGLRIVTTQDFAMQEIMDASFTDDSFFSQSEFRIEVQYTVSTRNRLTDKVTHHPMRREYIRSMDEYDALIESMRDRILGANDEIIAELPIPVPQPQAAMIVIDYRTGEVKAMAGGRGDKHVSLGLNRATQSRRGPGSVFKVVASFAPGIDMERITPATVIDDVPFEHHPFRNYYGHWRGLQTVRQGVYDSLNVVTVRNMHNIGIDNCFNYLLNFGFTTLAEREEIGGQIFTDRTLSASLGGLTHGVTQLEVAAAYGVMANDGIYVKPRFYSRVYDHDGNIILNHSNEEPRRVLKAQSAYLLTHMMQDVLTVGTGGRARFREVKMPIAGKTGTTTATKDLSFAGYTPYYVASIWLGFDGGDPMRDNSGYHMNLWRNVMEKIHADLEYREFERPEGIVSASVCRQSGQLGVSGLCDHDPRGNMIRSEIFIAGTVPNESCQVHVRISIDTSTGMPAGPFCPPDLVESVVRIVRPIPYIGDAVPNDRQYEVRREELGGQECVFHSLGAIPPGYYFDPETGMLVPIENGETPSSIDGDLFRNPNDDLWPASTPQPTPTPWPSPTPLPDSGLVMPTPTPTMQPTPTPVPEFNPQSGFGTATPTPTSVPQPTPTPGNNLPIIDEPMGMDEFVY